MKSQLRELFSFTDSERNGVIVLLIVIIILSLFISMEKMFITLPKEDFTAFDKFIAQLKEDSITTRNTDSLSYSPNSPEGTRRVSFRDQTPNLYEEAGQHSVYHSRELFNFNPNGLSVDDWVRLGLSPAQARSVKNFEAKGGKFECKEDVKKLFVISAERYNELEPYIVLPEKKINHAMESSPPVPRPTPLPAIIELNTADSTLLVSINGIGPSFAKRILIYREKLGGFYSIDQLKEVFGIDEEKFNAIKNSVKADPAYIRKININTSSAIELKRLPYLTWTAADALVNYRKAHGNFKSVEEIKSCALITDEVYRKIAPYLTI
jgi:competence ComEA-like helix-hairpin-helix protein